MTRRTALFANLIAALTDTSTGLRLLIACVFATWAIAAGATDSREVFSGESHAWLRAVGKLQVPGQRYQGDRKSVV